MGMSKSTLRSWNTERPCGCRSERRWRAASVRKRPWRSRLCFEDADALGATQPDTVFGEQGFIFIDMGRKRIDHSPDALKSARRRFERQAADAEIAGHHPLAGDVLVNLHYLFALAEAVEEYGHRAQVDGVRPSQTRCEAMRVSSVSSTRIYCARLGTSRPMSFSAARQ